MAASDNRSSSSLSMSALVSSAIGLQAGFSTNCRRHALQAYLALPLWICPFRTTRLEPQLGHLGRGCFSLIPPLYNHYPLITIEFSFLGSFRTIRMHRIGRYILDRSTSAPNWSARVLRILVG